MMAVTLHFSETAISQMLKTEALSLEENKSAFEKYKASQVLILKNEKVTHDAHFENEQKEQAIVSEIIKDDFDLHMTRERRQALETEKRLYSEHLEKVAKIHFQDPITIDVGGTRFKTAIATLTKEYGSMLSAMFSGPGFKLEKGIASSLSYIFHYGQIKCCGLNDIVVIIITMTPSDSLLLIVRLICIIYYFYYCHLSLLMIIIIINYYCYNNIKN